MDRIDPLDDPKDLTLERGHAPALWFALPFLTGCLVDATWLIHPGYCFLGATISLLVACLCTRHAVRWTICIILTGLSFGACWHSLRAGRMESWEGEPGRADLFVEVSQVHPREDNRWRAIGWVQTGPTDTRRRNVLCDGYGTAPNPGSLHVLSGLLSECGQRDNPRENWCRSQNISLRLTRATVAAEIEAGSHRSQWENRLGKKFADGFGELAWEDARGSRLLTATMVGQTRLLESEDRLVFAATGTLHLFAISGLHITGMALALVWAGKKCRLDDRVAGALALTALWLYVEVTGGTPSASRAWMMAACILACTTLRRRPHPLQGLFLACAITLVLDPQAATDAGFQLSYASVAGILLIGSPAVKYLNRPSLATRLTPKEAVPMTLRMGRWLRMRLAEGFCISLSASLAGTPIALSVFGNFCPGGVFANLFLVPLSGFPVVLGMISVGLSFTSWLDIPRRLVNSAAASWLHGMAQVAEILATLPGMSTAAQWRADWVGVGATVSVLGVMLWPPHQPNAWWILGQPFVVLLFWLLGGIVLI